MMLKQIVEAQFGCCFGFRVGSWLSAAWRLVLGCAELECCCKSIVCVTSARQQSPRR